MTGKIRKAAVDDAREIHRLLETFAAKGLLLPRPLWDIYSHIREFHLWEDDGGEPVGICALHVIWEDLAEIRSFCVLESHQGKSIGLKLARSAMSEGLDLGVRRVFVLTYVPSYFERLGFHRVDKSELPQKVWVDCIHCVKFPDCDEISLIRDLGSDDVNI